LWVIETYFFRWQYFKTLLCCALCGKIPKAKSMKIVLSIFLALVVSLGANAQSRNVKGLVLNEEMYPLWGASIYINDSIKVGETDLNGKCEFITPVGVDSIIFRGVGFEPLLVVLSTGCNRVEVIMILAGSYDFMSPAKVDRQRHRYFKKISQLYPVAVQKGLFSSEAPCCKAIFQPDAPRMKEMHRQWLRKQHSTQQQL
jgi:hypothetical protein